MIIALNVNETKVVTYPGDSGEKKTQFTIRASLSLADRRWIGGQLAQLRKAKTGTDGEYSDAAFEYDIIRKGLLKIDFLADASGSACTYLQITDDVIERLPEEITRWLAGEILEGSYLAKDARENFPSPSGA
jgi:hypothetical protein